MADDAATLREARQVLARHRGTVLAFTSAQAIAVLAGLVSPWLLGELVDGVVQRGSAAPVDILTALIAGSLVIRAATRWLASRTAFVFGETVFAELRSSFTDRLLDLPLSVVERTRTGDVISRTTRDIDAVAGFVRVGLPEVLIGALSVLLTTSAMLFVHSGLALCCLLGMPSIMLSTRWFTRRVRSAFAEELSASASVSTAVLETIHGASVVTGLGLQDRRQAEITLAADRSAMAQREPLRLRTRWFPFVQFGYYLPSLVVVVIGGFLVIQGAATIGQVATVAIFVGLLIDPLDDLVYWYGELQLARAAFARIVGAGQVPPDRVGGSKPPRGTAVVLQDVHFAYRGSDDVLVGVSLEIQPGEHLTVVGGSGAGKSTLGLLIAGVHLATAGLVTIGGQDLRRVSTEMLRQQVALVTQEPHVFSGTVADNVRLVRWDATPAAVSVALEIVGARDWVEALPSGFNTRVGAGGYELTLAQAQHLALARIMLAPPPVIVLDEAFSLLDDDHAQRLEESLAGVLSGRTVISIAHRLHSVESADRILMMNGGLIIEAGPHTELLSDNGAYAALWRAWGKRGVPPEAYNA